MEVKAVNSLRTISLNMINNAKSGHSGIALGIAPIMYSLFSFINHSPKAATHPLRDRFVLSAGHGSAVLYSTLYAFGYDFSTNDLKNFRNMGSITPGHPELDTKRGVECTTGPLGQGVAMAVGMALGQKMLADKFNKTDFSLFENRTYAVVGEGCLMEGVSYEALSFAGTQKLNNLVVIYDCNSITLDSDISNTFTQDIEKYVMSLGFNFLEVENGNSVEEIMTALAATKQSDKPTFIKVNTTIGHDSSFQNSHRAHGAVLKREEIDALKAKWSIKNDFEVDADVSKHFSQIKQKYVVTEKEWDKKLKDYKKLYSSDHKRLQQFLCPNFSDAELHANFTLEKPMSTREMGGIVLNNLTARYENIVGGSADVSSSTRAFITDGGVVSAKDYNLRNIFYGVREFAMGCITNGLALMGFSPFASTFLAFYDYLKPSIRLAAIMKLPNLYVFTHDSLFVGEDGATHQPIEQLASLRSLPNLDVFRPCNEHECAFAYAFALNNIAPTAVVLTRQNLPVVEKSSNIKCGGYVVSSEQKGQLHAVIIASGSEVSLALSTQKKLRELGFNVRVVSMLCTTLFDCQTEKYKNSVFQNSQVPRLAVEAGSPFGLAKYTKNAIAVSHYGLSGKGEKVYESMGFNEENIVAKIKELIHASKSKTYSLF